MQRRDEPLHLPTKLIVLISNHRDLYFQTALLTPLKAGFLLHCRCGKLLPTPLWLTFVHFTMDRTSENELKTSFQSVSIWWLYTVWVSHEAVRCFTHPHPPNYPPKHKLSSWLAWHVFLTRFLLCFPPHSPSLLSKVQTLSDPLRPTLRFRKVFQYSWNLEILKLPFSFFFCPIQESYDQSIKACGWSHRGHL